MSCLNDHAEQPLLTERTWSGAVHSGLTHRRFQSTLGWPITSGFQKVVNREMKAYQTIYRQLLVYFLTQTEMNYVTNAQQSQFCRDVSVWYLSVTLSNPLVPATQAVENSRPRSSTLVSHAVTSILSKQFLHKMRSLVNKSNENSTALTISREEGDGRGRGGGGGGGG